MNSRNIGSSLAGSAGFQLHEQLKDLETLSVAIRLKMLTSLLSDTYTRTWLMPGAIEIASSISNTCSVSLHRPVQLKADPSVEMAFTGTLFGCPTLAKYAWTSAML